MQCMQKLKIKFDTLLIHSDIVNVVSEGKLSDVRFATIATKCEIQKQIMLESWNMIGKWILMIAIIATILCL